MSLKKDLKEMYYQESNTKLETAKTNLNFVKHKSSNVFRILTPILVSCFVIAIVGAIYGSRFINLEGSVSMDSQIRDIDLSNKISGHIIQIETDEKEISGGNVPGESSPSSKSADESMPCDQELTIDVETVNSSFELVFESIDQSKNTIYFKMVLNPDNVIGNLSIKSLVVTVNTDVSLDGFDVVITE